MIVIRGKSSDGETPTVFSIDDNLAKNLDEAIKRNHRGWDYVCIITGLPGVGKSTFGRYIGRYLDEQFSNENIYFEANRMIERASSDGLYRSQLLDESFKDFGTNAARSTTYFDLVNWLQLSRQKRGFLILILPDFFSLSKTLAIFRSSHLFVIYEDADGERAFAAFDREAKKQLYILGKQFMNYNAVQPSFRGRFPKECQKGDIINIEKYDAEKLKHLKEQGKEIDKMGKHRIFLTRLVKYVVEQQHIPPEELAKITGMGRTTIYDTLVRAKALGF